MTRCIFFKKKHKKKNKHVHVETNKHAEPQLTDTQIHNKSVAPKRGLIIKIRNEIFIGAYSPAANATQVIEMNKLYQEILRADWEMLTKKHKENPSAEADQVFYCFNQYFNYQASPEKALSTLSSEIMCGEFRDMIQDLKNYNHFMREKAQYQISTESYLTKLRERKHDYPDQWIRDQIMLDYITEPDRLKVYYNIAAMIWSGLYGGFPHRKEYPDVRNFYEKERKILAEVKFIPLEKSDFENQAIQRNNETSLKIS